MRLLAASMWLILSGCTIVSQPPKPSVFSMQDFAVVTLIDDAVIPPAYRPAAGVEPLVAWRVEIPAGRHLVEILNKETAFCGASVLGVVCTVVEKSSHRVEFSAEPGRAYVPVVDEKCGRKWFWIVDGGQLPPAGGEKVSPLPFSNRLPAVGGETPPDGPC